MNKHIEHALKDWAKAKGLNPDDYILVIKSDDSVVRRPKHPALDLNWWREVPIRDWWDYENELRIIIENTFSDKPLNEIVPSELKAAFHNATIPQRCEAKYKADMG